MERAMPNQYGAPEISVGEVSDKFEAKENFILLDVREEIELGHAKLQDGTFLLLPLSLVAEKQLEAIPPELSDKDTEIVVMCHHGMRSAQVTAWFLQNGWKNVLSMAGGIDAYAKQIDSSIGMY